MRRFSIFDYIESIIEWCNTFTMESFSESVNKFPAFNEYQILVGYGKVTRKLVVQKVYAEYENSTSDNALNQTLIGK